VLLPVGVSLSAVEHTVAPTGTVNCTVHITNVLERRVVVQAQLERPVNGQWQSIPCRQPGPMYVSALWVPDPSEVKTVVLPTPPERGNDVVYRISVDYWLRLPITRVWKEHLRQMWDAGFLFPRRKLPNPGDVVKHPGYTVMTRLDGTQMVFNHSGYMVIGGRGDTAIDWSARGCTYTEAWNGVQPTDAPNPAPAPWFQFEADWRGVGDP